VKPLSERQLFERWASRRGFGLARTYSKRACAGYHFPDTAAAWMAWQAANRAAKRAAKGGAL